MTRRNWEKHGNISRISKRNLIENDLEQIKTDWARKKEVNERKRQKVEFSDQVKGPVGRQKQ